MRYFGNDENVLGGHWVIGEQKIKDKRQKEKDKSLKAFVVIGH